MDRFVLLASVCLVLSAGCMSDGGVVSSPTATAGSADTPTPAPTWTETESVTAAEVASVHENAVSNVSYTIVGATSWARNATVAVTANASYVESESGTEALVVDGTRYRYTPSSTGSETFVAPAETHRPRGGIAAELGRIGDVTLESNGTVERGALELRDLQAVENESRVRVLVDRRGVVRTYTFSVLRGGEYETFDRLEVTDVGHTDVPRPAWLTPVEDVSVSENDTYLRHHNKSIGFTAHVRGEPGHVNTVRTSSVGPPYLHDLLNRSRTSPLVRLVSTFETDTERVRIEYDDSMLPDGAAEEDLQIHAFNRTHQWYFPVETRLDTENDTAFGTQVEPVTRPTEDGTRTIHGSMDPSDAPFFVVLHRPTWEDTFDI